MKPLPEKCKKAITEQRCLGCVGLAEEDWIPPQQCLYLSTAEESIAKIKQNLGIQERIKL